ncbi:hypothetical protein R1flu_015796 [Riccia fluitans]|uniref:Uncharacterized protein n=1 Tax=Riccia fluitans TaxID=41844 RepID=A0ABD1YKC6_9MARC
MRSRRSNTWFLPTEMISKAESLHVEGRGEGKTRGIVVLIRPTLKLSRQGSVAGALGGKGKCEFAQRLAGSVVCLEFIILFDGVLAMKNREAWEG